LINCAHACAESHTRAAGQPNIFASEDRLKSKLKKKKPPQRLHKVTPDQLKEVGAPLEGHRRQGHATDTRPADWRGASLSEMSGTGRVSHPAADAGAGRMAAAGKLDLSLLSGMPINYMCGSLVVFA
jgi:hypothetical protein